MSTLERAIEIAARAHAGQLDKAGSPYILHPLRVMMKMDSSTARMAAVLHDVVEDTEVTLDELKADGFGDDVLSAIAALTKAKGESRLSAVVRARANPVARAVKLADVADNMDLSRIASPGAKDLARMEEYKQVLAYLKSDT